MSMYKISQRGVLARSLYKISVQDVYRRSLCKISVHDLYKRSLAKEDQISEQRTLWQISVSDRPRCAVHGLSLSEISMQDLCRRSLYNRTLGTISGQDLLDYENEHRAAASDEKVREGCASDCKTNVSHETSVKNWRWRNFWRCKEWRPGLHSYRKNPSVLPRC